jgi:predicted MPP superfamily phosphohydrolase
LGRPLSAVRFAVFLAIVLSVWALFHVYLFSRALSIPAVAAVLPKWPRIALSLGLWLSYPLGRILSRQAPGWTSWSFELAGAVWMGVLFVACASLLAADLATGFGKLWLSEHAIWARSLALVVAAVFSCVAVVQNLRGPRVVEHEVVIPSLPESSEGLRVVQLSDLHLGSLLGARFLERRIAEVEALKPDLLLVTGDLVDGEVGAVRPLVPLLSRLKAPLGVWCVSGNHEFYAGLEKSMALHVEAGFRPLRDSWAEVAPRLVLAGVDDLSARKQLGIPGDPLPKAFSGIPPGSTVVYLSHSPLRARDAERFGASLMLSGHTHGGQIWPFVFVSSIPYPLQAGRYEIGKMTLLVSRGTGTWGPPMRLFHRSEIVSVTLRGG